MYRLYERPVDRLYEAVGLPSRNAREFWAIKDISFEAAPGEVFGIVGPNGAGKSTLLQMICGVLPPTSGRVVVQGRVAALLELGAGFNPEFTGRENARLSAELAGVPAAELDRAIDNVEAFAGVGQFFDRPAKEYSTGMYVRVAFSTAIHVDPDVLIIDEALAVGDALFSSKCVRKLHELKDAGKTMLFVSHDLGLVKQLCDRAMFLYGGENIAIGDAADVTNRYVALVQSSDPGALLAAPQDAHHGDRRLTIEHVALLNQQDEPSAQLNPGEFARVRVEVLAHQDIDQWMSGILIRTRKGLDVFGTNSRQENVALPHLRSGQRLTLEFSFRCALARQEYTLTVAVQGMDGLSLHWIDDVLSFHVSEPRDLAGVVDLEASVRVIPPDVV